MMIVTSTEYFRIHSQTISMFLFLQKYFTEDVDTGNYLCLVCYCWCWHVCPDSVLQTNWLSERCCSAVHCTVVYSVWQVVCLVQVVNTPDTGDISAPAVVISGSGVSGVTGHCCSAPGHTSTPRLSMMWRADWSCQRNLLHLLQD